ncbi:MAG: hypothetical protein U0V74_17385 [Chitinophagales bacterium]
MNNNTKPASANSTCTMRKAVLPNTHSTNNTPKKGNKIIRATALHFKG